ncbi:MAG: hypothetical protein JNJ50_23305 [Acidobacteria bacterium]|nr:hypothetical protein [Acidobacteriota bacterium]
MSENKEQNEIKEYADGWITERKGTEVPAFLKFAYIIIAGGCLTYLVIYMNGETGHAERGPLVQLLNAVTGSANGVMYTIVGIGVIYALVLVAFVFRKFHD